MINKYTSAKEILFLSSKDTESLYMFHVNYKCLLKKKKYYLTKKVTFLIKKRRFK